MTTPGTVVFEPNVLTPVLDDAAAQYRRAWDCFRRGDRYLPRCWALLVGQAQLGGRAQEALIQVQGVRWARNVRETDSTALEEFSEVIVPCFGSGYSDGRRGYWCDPADVLRISREAEAASMDVLGSVHMHADMHRFWPERAAGLQLSECPTPMDEYLFRNGAWPLNLICYLEGDEDLGIAVRLGAWAPPPFGDTGAPAVRLDVRTGPGPGGEPTTTEESCR
ncbi:MAG: hypothetical protein ACRDOI_22100 [Trebonia sp.]